MNKKFIITLLWTCLSLSARQARLDEPNYTSDGQLKRPENYREWVFLSSGLGMTYGIGAPDAIRNQRFDNVFVTPQAYKSFLETGRWPDKTMFVLEVRSASTKGSINKGGHFQEELVTIEAHVKDENRFPSGWEFFGFGGNQTAKPLGAKSSCQTCHAQHGAVESTFVQFYPTLLPVAKAKGTLKPQEGR